MNHASQTTRKLGNVMWSKTVHREMVPTELHGRISLEEEKRYNNLHECMLMYRKIGPILSTIIRLRWEQKELMIPIMQQTLITRSGAREMRASGDWDAFWSGL